MRGTLLSAAPSLSLSTFAWCSPPPPITVLLGSLTPPFSKTWIHSCIYLLALDWNPALPGIFPIKVNPLNLEFQKQAKNIPDRLTTRQTTITTLYIYFVSNFVCFFLNSMILCNSKNSPKNLKYAKLLLLTLILYIDNFDFIIKGWVKEKKNEIFFVFLPLYHTTVAYFTRRCL